MTSIHTRLCRVVATLTLALTAAGALAQAYPSRPVKLVVPFPPGGPTDVVGRLVAAKLGESLGQPVVVENRPGAGGTVGSDAVAKSPPDGYTLLFGSTSTLAMAPSLYKNLPYDPQKAFAPISRVSIGPLLIAVNANVPARTLKELIELAQREPRRLNYGSAGNGTPPHLAAEYFKTLAGVDIVHVPYKGGGPALQALIAGEVQVLFEGQVTLDPHIRSGKVRALAITSPQRDSALPDVPTVAEAGLPAFQVQFWSGLAAPAGTPPEIVQRLNGAVLAALETTEVRETLARQGLKPAGGSPAEFASFIAAEVARWADVVHKSGARID
jgi:tripartite-type tricarboxylate transporter receptor subunit TctC